MATLSSGYVSTEPISILSTNVWSFVAPQNPAIKATGVRVRQPLNLTIDESTGVFKPLGGADKIVVANSIYGTDGDYEITTQGEVEWALVKAIITYQGTIYVQDPLGRQKYIRIITRSWVESGKLSYLHRAIKLTYVEVGAP